MFGVLVIVLLIGVILATVRPLLMRGHDKLKVVLVLLYIAFIAQCIDAYYSANYADEHYLVGYAVDWFGSWWLAVLLATLMAIIGLHTWLIVAWRKS